MTVKDKLKALLRVNLPLQDLLFRANPWLGRVFTTAPMAVFCIASVSSLIFMFVPAFRLGIAHIPTPHGEVGFASLAKANWSLMYPLFLPLFLVLAGSACKAILSAVNQFVSPGQAVVFDKSNQVAVGYPCALAEMMRERGRLICIAAAILALLVVAGDTHDLWPGFFTGHFPDSRAPEWDTAFRLLDRPPLFRWEVFGFDVVAYLFEFSYIFLGIFFVLSCWSFLMAIAITFDNARPPFRFKPIVCDLEKRLGLGPLSWVFHWLLLLGIAFGTYAALHRLEQVDTLRHFKAGTYAAALFSNPQQSDSAKKDSGFSVSALISLTQKDYAISELMNASSWLAIVFIALPGAVVCILPLGRIYQYVRRTRSQLLAENKIAYNAAVLRGDKETADKLAVQIRCLEEANIWPNGNTAAYTCLILLVGVLVVSITPPLLPFALSAGALPSLYAFVTKKRGND